MHANAGLQQLLYRGIANKSLTVGISNASTSIPVVPAGWPNRLYAARVYGSKYGCTHLAPVAAHLHDTASRAGNCSACNFTEDEWHKVEAYLGLSSEDCERLHTLASSIKAKVDSRAQEVEAASALRTLPQAAACSRKRRAEDLSGIPASGCDQGAFAARLIREDSRSLSTRGLAGPASQKPSAGYSMTPAEVSARMGSLNLKYLPPTPTVAAQSGNKSSLASLILDRRQAAADVEDRLLLLAGSGSARKQPGGATAASAAAAVTSGTAAGTARSHRCSQQWLTSSHTCSGAGTDKDMDVDGAERSVMDMVQDLQQQQAAVTMEGMNGSYQLQVRGCLGRGGEGSVWQVELQPGSDAVSAAAAAAARPATGAVQASEQADHEQHSSDTEHGRGSSSSLVVNRLYALKVAGTLSKFQRRNLYDEFNALSAVSSKHVVQVFDMGALVLRVPVGEKKGVAAMDVAGEARGVDEGTCEASAAASEQQLSGQQAGIQQLSKQQMGEQQTNGQQAGGAGGDDDSESQGPRPGEVWVPCMLLELSNVGSLSSYVRAVNQMGLNQEPAVMGLTQQQSKHAALHVLRGLCQMHSKNMLHRDVKPENVLGFVPDGVDPLKQPELITWKVSDLGCAFRFSGNLLIYPTTYVGTPGPAMAPEVQATKKARGSCHYNWPAEVWAFAMLWVQMRFGVLAFSYTNDPDRWSLAELTSPDCPYTAADSEAFAGGPMTPIELDFISRCMHPDPQQRSSVDRLLVHPYMALANAGAGATGR